MCAFVLLLNIKMKKVTFTHVSSCYLQNFTIKDQNIYYMTGIPHLTSKLATMKNYSSQTNVFYWFYDNLSFFLSGVLLSNFLSFLGSNFLFFMNGVIRKNNSKKYYLEKIRWNYKRIQKVFKDLFLRLQRYLNF